MKSVLSFSVLFVALCVTLSVVSGAPNTQDSAALVREGINLISRERYRDAKVALQAALALNPESKTARYYLNLIREWELRKNEAHILPLVPIAPDLRT